MSIADINASYRTGTTHLAICSREVTVEDVMKIADSGCIMPPKVLTGDASA